MQFEYFYGAESQQFAFYRIPKILVKDYRFRKLSSDAKLLYGLMLDRMSLSISNGWFDEEDRAFIIYTIENITDELGIGRDKAIKILAELDDKKGIGLIERKRRGQGKPDIIYVKNFIIRESARISEVEDVDFQKSEKPTSRNRNCRPQEVGKSDPNYTDKNNTKKNDTESIYPSLDGDKMDEIYQDDYLINSVKRNIEYDFFRENLRRDEFLTYEELFEVICEIVCGYGESIRINGVEYQYEFVRNRFLKLNSEHMQYVMSCMKSNYKRIRNIKAYMIATLFNAPGTINHYYQQEVNADMYGYG